VFRLTGQPLSPDREQDVGWWFQKGPKPWHLVAAPLEQWLRAFDGDETWELAIRLRHGFTHRTVSRDVTIVVGDATRPSGYVHLNVAGTRHESEDVMRQLLTYGKGRYSDFERALARSHPMPDD
jgi:hypothetical protein